MASLSIMAVPIGEGACSSCKTWGPQLYEVLVGQVLSERPKPGVPGAVNAVIQADELTDKIDGCPRNICMPCFRLMQQGDL